MWNLIGVAAWVLLVAYLIFIIWNIRARHLQMVIRKRASWPTVLVDLVEVVVLLAAAYGMFWVTWLAPVDYTDNSQVGITYRYANLVIQPDASRSYYVTVQSGAGKESVRYYTYWTAGAKTEISSHNADVSSDTNILTVKASAYPWNTARLAELNRTSEGAWVAEMRATYKPSLLNGLGMHVGHQAKRFDLIRVPNDTVIKVLPLGED